jgi:uncharacterized damage-inducible protein DinB
MIDLLKKYTAYNLWANKRVIIKLVSLPEKMLNKELKSSFRSITLTVLHMYDAETIWLNRLEGISLNEWPAKNFKGSPAEAMQLLEYASIKIADYTNNISGDSLYNDCTFTSLEGKPYTMKIYDIIQHCMNHSTFHRGQIITMLRELDIAELPSTDYIAYLRSYEK